MEKSEESLRPRRIAAKKVLTYNINYDQVGYYEQRELQRALKYSLIEAEEAKRIKQDKKKKKLEDDKSLNLIKKNQINLINNKIHVDENLDGNTDTESIVNLKKELIVKKCSSDNVSNVFLNKKLNKPTTEQFLNYLCFRGSNVLLYKPCSKNGENIDCENLNNIDIKPIFEKEKTESNLNQYNNLSMVSNKEINLNTKSEKNCVVFSQNNVNEKFNTISPFKKSKKKIEITNNDFTLNIENEHKNNLNTHNFINNNSLIKLESQINKFAKNKNVHRPTRKAKPNVSLYDFHIEFDDEECSIKNSTRSTPRQTLNKKQSTKNSKIFSIQTCIKNEIRKKLLQKSIKLSKKYSSKKVNENNLNKNNGFKKCRNSVNNLINKGSKKFFNRSNKCIKNKKSNKKTMQRLNRTKNLNSISTNIKIKKNELLKKSEMIIKNLYKFRQYLNLKKQQLTSLNLEKNEQNYLISSKITALRLMAKDLQNSIIDPNNFDINTYDPLTISGLLSTSFSRNFSCKKFLSNLIFSNIINTINYNEEKNNCLKIDNTLHNDECIFPTSSLLIEN